MSETCPDCGRPYARNKAQWWGSREFCPTELSRTACNDSDHLELNCATETIERLRARLASAESVIAVAKEMRESGTSAPLGLSDYSDTSPEAEAFDEALEKYELEKQR